MANRKLRYSVTVEPELSEDIDLLSRNEPLMAGLAPDRRRSAYHEMVLRQHRDANQKKVNKFKKNKK